MGERMKKLIVCSVVFTSTFLIAGLSRAELEPGTELTLAAPQPQESASAAKPSIWNDGVGEGFRTAAQSLTLSLGASVGVPILGGHVRHDLALSSFTYGRVLGPVLGNGHWYRGNFEGRLEVFTGAQFSPNEDWVVGLAPHIRYDFATGTPFVPFLDVGAGLSGSGIGPPDLNGGFEFNLQACVGAYYFLRPDLALDVDARLLHMSSAGLLDPNLGLNTILATIGLSWFF